MVAYDPYANFEVTSQSYSFKGANYDPLVAASSGPIIGYIFQGYHWYIENNITESFYVERPGDIVFAHMNIASDVKTSYNNETGAITTINRSFSSSGAVLPLNITMPVLVAGYKAGRGYTEVVSLSLFADVQPILTDPDDGEALRIDDIRSVNLSEPIGGIVPIGDSRRRSYIATARGNQSVEHLIALARAHLMKRARVVEISFVPKLERMPEVTLRKNVFLIEPRIGEALGKIIGHSISLDGADGRINCEVRIGCTIGRGGSAVASGGEPLYCSIDYAGADYQQFTGRVVLFDTSIGYQPPAANPNDDGLNLLSVMTAQDVIETPLVVEFPPAEQAAIIQSQLHYELIGSPILTVEQEPDAVEIRGQAISDVLKQCTTRATFKLKSMTRDFSSDYEIQVTDLNIPTGYDLEAV